MGCGASKEPADRVAQLSGNPTTHWRCPSCRPTRYLAQKDAGNRFPDCERCGSHLVAPTGGGQYQVWICWGCRTHLQTQRETPPKCMLSCKRNMEKVPPGSGFSDKLFDMENALY